MAWCRARRTAAAGLGTAPAGSTTQEPRSRQVMIMNTLGHQEMGISARPNGATTALQAAPHLHHLTIPIDVSE
ncbi:jg12982 [Pararge aegeria aegeria]|uniref:Jg12982 protein n=1 Tax=Pararge aegeria aegeria TaxID=348720 RepID=A0A8S4RYG6_9NEOP|nr:jg12982 [Pararge aegeria aegeria]